MQENNGKSWAEKVDAGQQYKEMLKEREFEEAKIAAEEEQEKEDPLKILEAENAKLKDELLRSLADNDNLRKRFKKEMEDVGDYAVTSFSKDMINVLENLFRALGSVTKEQVEENNLLKNVIEGVEMTKKELIAVFEKNGIKRIYPEIGEKFDHNLHQAVVNIPSNDYEEGSILNVMQAGYILKNRLLRPAMVGLSKAVKSSE